MSLTPLSPPKEISDDLKIKICDIVRQTFEDYGLDLNTEEDANYVWYLLRYGCTVEEFDWEVRQAAVVMQKWLAKQNNPELLEKFNHDFKETLTYKENRGYMTLEQINSYIEVMKEADRKLRKNINKGAE